MSGKTPKTSKLADLREQVTRGPKVSMRANLQKPVVEIGPVGLDKDYVGPGSRLAREAAEISSDALKFLKDPSRYGRNPDGTSKRLELRIILSAPVSRSDIQGFDIDKLGAALPIPVAGGQRQRGGGITESIQAAKAIGMMLVYKGKTGLEGSADYVKTEIISPIFGTTSRVARILISLADQLFVKTPVTGVMGALAIAGFTANVAANIAKKFNTWGREQSRILLSDDAAERAAAIAVGDFKSIATTAAVGIAVASQIGILPLSTLAAAILGGLKITVKNPALRGNVVAALYAWYLSQPVETQTAIKAQAEQYANGAKIAATDAGAKVKTVAKALAPYLLAAGAAAGAVALAAPGAAAAAVAAAPGTAAAAMEAANQMITVARVQIGNMNAFQAVVAALSAAGITGGAAPPVAQDGAEAILADNNAVNAAAAADAGVGAFGPELEAAVAAAMAAEPARPADPAQVAAVAAEGEGAAAVAPAAGPGDAAMQGAPQGGRRYRRKTKRVKKVRRMTRRRPIFSY